MLMCYWTCLQKLICSHAEQHQKTPHGTINFSSMVATGDLANKEVPIKHLTIAYHLAFPVDFLTSTCSCLF